jgi:hypothetical protein
MLFTRRTRVEMRVSIGELVAGRKYRLPTTYADELIVKQYATGTLSRPYTDDERVAFNGPTQTVSV